MKYYFLLFFLGVKVSLHAQNATVTEYGKELTNLGLPHIVNYTPKNYLANPQNHDAIQDDNGIMYFGNLWNILQFDGTMWSKIYLPNGLSCTSLAKDKNGTIYIGGRNEIGYLKTDSIGVKHYISLLGNVRKTDRDFNEVWATYITTNGVLFVSYESLLFKPDNQEKIIVLRKNITNAFYVNNQIYLLDENGLSVYKNDTFHKISNEPFLLNIFIRSILPLNNQLLLSTDKGLYLFNGTSCKEWNTPVNTFFKSSKFEKVIKTTDNHLVFTTQLNGVIITDLNGNILLHLNKSKGLAANSITGCYTDKNNNLWLTANSGISYIPLSDRFYYLNDFSGITGIPYSSAIYHNQLYLSTSEGLFKKNLLESNTGLNQNFEKVNAISGLIWNLKVFDDKLFCGQATGAYVIDGQTVQKIHDQGTWLFHQLEEGKLLLIGTYQGLAILEKKDGKWQLRNTIKGFKESSRYVVEDKYGDIWISHGNKGVYQIRLDKAFKSVSKLKFFGKKEGLPADFDNTVYKINDDIFVSGLSGLFKYNYDTEKIIPYKPLAKILDPHWHIEGLVKGTDKHLWAIFNRGEIAKISMEPDERYKLIWKTKRIKNNWVESFEHLNPISRNELIIGTQEGFSIFKGYENQRVVKSAFNCFVSKLESITDKPEVIWNGYSVNHFPVKKALLFSQRSVKILFTATSYEDVENNQFQYYLGGFNTDERWSDWSGISFKEYTNLKEGKYFFHVRAMNSAGQLSEENILEFEVLPPWYRTAWAYIVYLFLAVIVVYVTQKLAVKWLEKEKKKIALDKQRKLWKKEQEWKESTLEKEKLLVVLQQQKLEAESIALHQKELLLEQKKDADREIFQMQQDKLEADLSARNNELTSLTVHITQKNEVLTKIKNSLHRAIKDTHEETTKTSLAQVEQLIEKNLNSIKEWEKFSEHFDMVHEGFLKNLQHHYPDLKASSLKLCAYIKMKLSSKQIAVLMNTETESVIKARYRLRLKFNLAKEVSLEEFLNNSLS